MRVALISNRNRPGFPGENIRDHLKWIKQAADQSARLVLFPELSLTGYSVKPFMKKYALPLRNRYADAIARAAREHQLFVAFGMALKDRGKMYISHVLMGPGGRIGHYEKVHVTTKESKLFSPGRSFEVFDVEGVQVGINICMDCRYPASSLCAAHLGAEVILHPFGNNRGHLGLHPKDWIHQKLPHTSIRALDAHVFLLCCNSTGRSKDRDGKHTSFCGGAFILDYLGKVSNGLRSTVCRPQMLVADLDMDSFRESRVNSIFERRQQATYLKALSQRRRL